MRSGLRALLREPLLHFLVLGAALFGTYRLSTARSADSDRILVSAGKLGSLAEAFRLTWQRAPSNSELQGLVTDYIREEVLVREAVRLGLDQDDPVVRRRLRTRMDIFFDDTAGIDPPTEPQLHAYLQAHPNGFRQESRTTFIQVYLSPERHGERMNADLRRVKAALERLAPDADPAQLGDQLMIDSRFEGSSEREVTRVFGEAFARELAAVPLDRWSGPLRSGYGLHLVHITDRVAGRSPRLEEVREAVQREWLSQETARAREAAYQALLRKVKVTVEPAPRETIAPSAAR
jgi:hypothetical protein